jgi:hypothetical protein
MNAIFTPLGIALGLAAGSASKKIFDKLWSLFDEEEAPHPKHRQIAFAKLIPALVLQGAIFRLVRGLTDHGSRHVWRRVIGAWPGDERPDPE